MPRLPGSALLLLLAVGCASAPADPEPDTSSSTPTVGRRSTDNVIEQAEIERSGASSAYDAIVKLRGSFLSDRGMTTIRGSAPRKPSVYIDGQYYGEVETLRNISVTRLYSIRLYRAYEAQQKFGSRLMGGVIDLTTKQ